MDENEIAEKIKRLDSVMIVGRPIAMGAAFYDACCARGLVAMDIQPRDANPSYRGLSQIVLPYGLPDWEFQIGPPHA
ncbi:MAG: hypothetical protein ACHP84_13715 [Caulobacterales bacterium]